ncbi:Ecp28-1 [Fulvia fulva]|uniref:Ecp28-1 n=1 Tax=Passalora fulva TaxID=5499 RepID=A0A1P8YXQ5_PASFU|nr:Ecp28-1 [Fulvia fulva]AQA29227.1 extracellular protein 28-1 [Fulvia fulva]KAK4635661.1 Ecp28-1 [Fulvia fulva]KAK4637194.1 Ecp28-1 [Fulvia fulva]UJO11654.1 Ecp28-1 [Fulvia fulva]WPV08158.1 Ecp28-1 [Fulvia fulva]
MQLRHILFLLSAAISVNASAYYNDCKCHDKANGLQDDAATEFACGLTTGATYSVDPHHQCHLSGDGIKNSAWEDSCNEYAKNQNNGKVYFQWCWNKPGNIS